MHSCAFHSKPSGMLEQAAFAKQLLHKKECSTNLNRPEYSRNLCCVSCEPMSLHRCFHRCKAENFDTKKFEDGAVQNQLQQIYGNNIDGGLFSSTMADAVCGNRSDALDCTLNDTHHQKNEEPIKTSCIICNSSVNYDTGAPTGQSPLREIPAQAPAADRNDSTHVTENFILNSDDGREATLLSSQNFCVNSLETCKHGQKCENINYSDKMTCCNSSSIQKALLGILSKKVKSLKEQVNELQDNIIRICRRNLSPEEIKTLSVMLNDATISEHSCKFLYPSTKNISNIFNDTPSMESSMTYESRIEKSIIENCDKQCGYKECVPAISKCNSHSNCAYFPPTDFTPIYTAEIGKLSKKECLTIYTEAPTENETSHTEPKQHDKQFTFVSNYDGTPCYSHYQKYLPITDPKKMQENRNSNIGLGKLPINHYASAFTDTKKQMPQTNFRKESKEFVPINDEQHCSSSQQQMISTTDPVNTQVNGHINSGWDNVVMLQDRLNCNGTKDDQQTQTGYRKRSDNRKYNKEFGNKEMLEPIQEEKVSSFLSDVDFERNHNITGNNYSTDERKSAQFTENKKESNEISNKKNSLIMNHSNWITSKKQVNSKSSSAPIKITIQVLGINDGVAELERKETAGILNFNSSQLSETGSIEIEMQNQSIQTLEPSFDFFTVEMSNTDSSKIQNNSEESLMKNGEEKHELFCYSAPSENQRVRDIASNVVATSRVSDSLSNTPAKRITGDKIVSRNTESFSSSSSKKTEKMVSSHCLNEHENCDSSIPESENRSKLKHNLSLYSKDSLIENKIITNNIPSSGTLTSIKSEDRDVLTMKNNVSKTEIITDFTVLTSKEKVKETMKKRFNKSELHLQNKVTFPLEMENPQDASYKEEQLQPFPPHITNSARSKTLLQSKEMTEQDTHDSVELNCSLFSLVKNLNLNITPQADLISDKNETEKSFQSQRISSECKNEIYMQHKQNNILNIRETEKESTEYVFSKMKENSTISNEFEATSSTDLDIKLQALTAASFQHVSKENTVENTYGNTKCIDSKGLIQEVKIMSKSSNCEQKPSDTSNESVNQNVNTTRKQYHKKPKKVQVKNLRKNFQEFETINKADCGILKEISSKENSIDVPTKLPKEFHDSLLPKKNLSHTAFIYTKEGYNVNKTENKSLNGIDSKTPSDQSNKTLSSQGEDVVVPMLFHDVTSLHDIEDKKENKDIETLLAAVSRTSQKFEDVMKKLGKQRVEIATLPSLWLKHAEKSYNAPNVENIEHESINSDQQNIVDQLMFANLGLYISVEPESHHLHLKGMKTDKKAKKSVSKERKSHTFFSHCLTNKGRVLHQHRKTDISLSKKELCEQTSNRSTKPSLWDNICSLFKKKGCTQL